jgi:hypothetical protein
VESLPSRDCKGAELLRLENYPGAPLPYSRGWVRDRNVEFFECPLRAATGRKRHHDTALLPSRYAPFPSRLSLIPST